MRCTKIDITLFCLHHAEFCYTLRIVFPPINLFNIISTSSNNQLSIQITIEKVKEKKFLSRNAKYYHYC